MPHRTGVPQPTQDPALSRRSLLLGLTAALVAGQVAGCGRGGQPTGTQQPPEVLTAEGVARLVPPAGAPTGAATAGMLGFGYDLCRAAASASKNFVASPVSIATAFAMLRAGARGSTASQLDTVFGYPPAGRDEAFNAITRALVTTAVPPTPSTTEPKLDAPPSPPVVCIGNALFTGEGLRIGADFLRTLAAQYGAGARPVDFTSATAAAKINAWVRQQTAGRIDKLFDQIDPQTLLVLANTVYLKADWASIFLDPPGDAPFRRTGAAPVTAAMMHQTASVGYAAADGWQAVEMPYAGGDLAMRIMLPAPGRSPDEMLAPARLGAVAARLADTRVALSVPRWDFASTVDLTTVLPAMGLTVPFSGAADFGGIAPGLTVDQAVHRANITVDQRGTVAAAVTGIAMAGSAPMPPPVAFTADRPFAFAIVGGPTRVPLFIGHVADPTAS